MTESHRELKLGITSIFYVRTSRMESLQTNDKIKDFMSPDSKMGSCIYLTVLEYKT